MNVQQKRLGLVYATSVAASRKPGFYGPGIMAGALRLSERPVF